MYRKNYGEIYHGGCLICTKQQTHGKIWCNNCQFKNANWDLPDLSSDNEDDSVNDFAILDRIDIYIIEKYLRKKKLDQLKTHD